MPGDTRNVGRARLPGQARADTLVVELRSRTEVDARVGRVADGSRGGPSGSGLRSGAPWVAERPGAARST